MAKTSQKVRQGRKAKYSSRSYNRCRRCGRPRAVYRKFGLCRICLREMAHAGELDSIDVNPLVVMDKGAVCLDAVITRKEPA